MPVHVQASSSDIAPFVLLPGDPDRATYIAETFFDNPKRYTEYRKMYGYTGTYKGKPVSVQTTGMGTPSASIVTEELISIGAKHLVRVGTCGGLGEKIALGDTLIATTAWGSREIVEEIAGFSHFCPSADMDFCFELKRNAKERNLTTHFGPIASVNLFYMDGQKHYPGFMKMGCLALEMEAAAIYALAAREGVRANCLLLVSDLFDRETLIPKRLPEEEIRANTAKMIELALEAYVNE